MNEFVGMSIGATNLVAVPTGRAPMLRRAVLTLFSHPPAEVGLPSENPTLTEPGLVLSGFVERVGHPVPIVAADGSTHRAQWRLAEALDAMASSVSPASLRS